MKREEHPGGLEEKIGHAMVKGRLLTEIQLKTALDYQRSLGGTLTEVITKLGFARPAVLARFLAEANLSASPTGPTTVKEALAEISDEPLAPDPEPSLEGDGVEPSELPTQRPVDALEEVETGPTASEPDPVLRALIHLLVKKGVIAPKEEEELLEAGLREILP